MKQITIKEVESISCTQSALETETRYAQAEWIQANARYIADIETKRTDKTLFGAWPKGWKHEMLRASKDNAKKALIERFLARECKQLDGAIWLGNWQIINQLESK